MTKINSTKMKKRSAKSSKSSKDYEVVHVEQHHYKFDKLSKASQDKVIENYRREFSGEDANRQAEDFNIDAGYDLNAAGYKDLELLYSLGHSQGDGVSFKGKVDVDKVMDKNPALKKKYGDLYGKDIILDVKNEGHYTHWNSFTVEVHNYYDMNDKELRKSDELADNIKKDLQEKSKELEKKGYSFVDSVYDDEVIKENIKANEYTYDENGKMW